MVQRQHARTDGLPACIGASGIGADIVRAFAGQGSKVAFVDLLETEGNDLAAAVGGLFIRCDVTDIAALKSAIARASGPSISCSILE